MKNMKFHLIKKMFEMKSVKFTEYERDKIKIDMID